MSDAESAEEQKTVGAKSILPKVVITMRKALNLGSFFTTGTDEVRQWTIRNGTKAPQAAGVIHGDFEKTFIQVVVYNYSVLREEGDEAGVKAKGKVMTKGKDYTQGQIGEGCKVISEPLHSFTTPPTSASVTFFLSSSLIPTFCRPAARPVCQLSVFRSTQKICVTLSPSRTYASAKKKKMPPKKAVKEEKVLLGRPGNNLKSGI